MMLVATVFAVDLIGRACYQYKTYNFESVKSTAIRKTYLQKKMKKLIKKGTIELKHENERLQYFFVEA